MQEKTQPDLTEAELKNILNELHDDEELDDDSPYQTLLLSKEKVFEFLEESTIVSSINHADLIMTNISHPRYGNGNLIVGINGEGILVYDEIIIKKYFKIEEPLTRQEMNQILADSEVLFEAEDGPLRIIHPTYGPAVLIPAGELYAEVKDDKWLIFHDETLDRPYPKYILSSIW